MQNFIRLISSFDPADPTFPPTEIFSEGWLLRLIMDWYSDHDPMEHPLAFHSGARWFSEALLPSPFLSRFRRDPLGEARTHADGVIGQIELGRVGKADLELDTKATQFLVLEAKINSRLSADTKNAPGFDQAARNVACIAEVLRRSQRRPSEMVEVAFFVLAPMKKIDAGDFDDELDPTSIRSKVVARAAAYDGEHDAWLAEWFLPLMEKIRIDYMSWEDIIQGIGEVEPDTAESFIELLIPGRSARSR